MFTATLYEEHLSNDDLRVIEYITTHHYDEKGIEIIDATSCDEYPEHLTTH